MPLNRWDEKTVLKTHAEGMALLEAANAVSDHAFGRGKIDTVGKEMLLHARKLRSQALEMFEKADAMNAAENARLQTEAA